MNVLNKVLNYVNTKYLKRYGTVVIEQHSIIDYRCEIDKKNNITIGKKSSLYKHITIYKNKVGQLNIGDFSHIAPYGYFLIQDQNLTIGNDVAIGPYCSIFCSSNAIPNEKQILFKDCYTKGDVRIGDNVFIGAQCVILPNTIIESNVVVAAHSTVKGLLLEGYVYGGNPAKKIRKVFE